jgi:hypothetical protein
MFFFGFFKFLYSVISKYEIYELIEIKIKLDISP